MPIQQHHVDELKDTYRRVFGKPLPDAEAWAMAHRLVGLFRLILKRSPKDEDQS